MTTKTEMTLENVCFRYDGSKEAKECIEIMNANYPNNFSDSVKFQGYEGCYYWINNEIRFASDSDNRGRIVISTSDYLLLLSAPESQAHLLREKDLIVGNRFECIKSYLDNGIERFTKGLVYSVRDNGLLLKGNRNYFVTTEDLNRHFKLASQPPVMEGREETLQDVINRVSPFGTMTISNPKMLIALEDFIGQKTSSLQSEVEQLKGLLKEAQPFCGTMLRGKIEHYTSK